MKQDQILALSKEEFLKELDRKDSRVAHSALRWSVDWLREHGEFRLAKQLERDGEDFLDYEYELDLCRKAVGEAK